MNHARHRRGAQTAWSRSKFPPPGSNATDEHKLTVAEGWRRKEVVDYVNKILIPVNAQHGDSCLYPPLKALSDGTFPQGSAAYEKRGIAVDVPAWNPENCIQCNFCSYVCPHAVIRPVVMTEEEAAKAPDRHQAGRYDRYARL